MARASRNLGAWYQIGHTVTCKSSDRRTPNFTILLDTDLPKNLTKKWVELKISNSLELVVRIVFYFKYVL
jgi:hypothetical protein